MKRFLYLTPILLALALLTGCESPGRALEKSAIDQIRDGQTTRAEVDRIFGEPRQMSKSPEGKTMYSYQRYYGPSAAGGPFSDEAHLMMLSVLFNSSDIVEKHLFSHTKPKVNSQMLHAGRKLSQEELSRIVPEKTTRTELNTWFGPHVSEELTFSGLRLVSWLYIDAYSLSGRTEVQALEVIMTDDDRVASFRVTKKDKQDR